uniref:ABC transporter ATP-binding protein n=1 Tax=Cellvibrio fontiphilus TaxID=1815559 RepID=UPI002B4BCB2C|nr:ABC transporter ATP-binding protein [Cellvibrio fontiphilus]
MSNAHHLSLSGIAHQFGEHSVLRDIHLQVGPGEILCLAGPSGCGKSTLLRLIAGLEQLQTGEIHLDNELIASPARQQLPEQRDIGLVFQDFALFPHLSLLDNVAFGLHQLPKPARAARALAMLERVGMSARAQDLPHVLSGGQQQRIALARALAPQPRLLLLDEPFSNLDVRLRHRLRSETLHLLKASGTTSIMVTHDPEEAMFMADRIALMQEGKVLQIGTPGEIYHHPVSPFAAEFFGDINRLEAQVEGGLVASPFGAIAASTLAEGSRAQILIRPEALQLAPANSPGAQTMRLQEAHMLGATSLASVCINHQSQEVELQMQLPSHQLAGLGDQFWVTLDKRGVFVFAAGD